MIYVILGQTASGKTSLALELARQYHLPIISADAYQCYRMMQIGDIPYYFYDEYDPDQDMDVYTFQQKIRPLLDDFVKRDQDVLIVGGTFLYIKALLFPYVFSDNGDSTRYAHMPLEEMRTLLRERDEKTYQAIDNRNPRRVIRALSLLDQGITRQDILSQNDQKPLYPVTFLRLDIDKDEGNRKIDDRIDRMFASGIVGEVRRLLARYPETCRSFLAIGYKEIIQGFHEGLSEKAMSDLIKVHTHQYAKKQRTFLAHQFTIDFSGDRASVKARIEEGLASHRKK